MHAERSRQYRARARSVTDQGIALEPTPTEEPISAGSAASAAESNAMFDARPAILCHFCGRSRSAFVRLGPIRRRRRRSLGDQTSRAAPRRRL
jgi:hypothetical protein